MPDAIPPCDPSIETRTTETKASLTSSNLALRVKNIEWFFRFVIIGITGAILLLAVDLYRNNEIHQRITELEKDIATYKVSIFEKTATNQAQINYLSNQSKETERQSGIFNCLSKMKYWQFEQCFK